MISIVIPVYNNQDTLVPLTQRIIATLQDGEFEIVFVNDGSTDNSLNVLRELVSQYDQVKALSLSRNFGQHAAICAGFDTARGDRIVLMDADLEDRPEHIPALLDRLNVEADIVYTVRKEGKTGLTSDLYHKVIARLTKTDVPAGIGTFRAFTGKVLQAIQQYPERNIVIGPLMFYIGFRSVFVEIERDSKGRRHSRYSLSRRLQLAVNSLVTYTDIPHRAFFWYGLVLIAGSLAYALVVILQYLVYGAQLPSGLTFIIIYLSLILGSVMLAIGVLGAYLFRVFEEVLRRPRYLIDEILEKSEDGQ